MKIKDFDFYKDLIKRESGLYLASDQAYLLSSRLTPIAKSWNFVDLDHMTMDLRGLPDEKLVKQIVEAMTDNETSFFRDPEIFDTIREDIIPDIISKKKFNRTVKIWSAGCSTGQEAYSLALLLQESPLKELQPTFKFQIDATDISEDALEQARNGKYSQTDVQNGLPVKTLMSNFDQNEKTWTAQDRLKNAISFRYFNLINNMRDLEEYDLILCRNVLEDFDYLISSKIIDQLTKKLTKDGYLVFGKDEMIENLTDKLRPVENVKGIYTVL